MKNIKLALLLSVILLNSCSAFQSKDELLTKSKWIATQLVYYDENGMSDSMPIKKEDEPLTLKFEKGGVCMFKNFESTYIEKREWHWSGKDKDYLVISDGTKAATLKVKFENDKLVLRRITNKNGEDINIINYDTSEGISLKEEFHFDTK